MPGAGSPARATLLALALALLCGAPAPASAAAPAAPPAELTHPSVEPPAGGPRRVFTLRFTERVAPGTAEGEALAYEVSLSRPGGGSARCLSASPEAIGEGEVGERVAVALRPPPVGWCGGRYVATVYLERRPACQGPPTALRRDAIACPLFIALTDTGSAGFRVRRAPVPHPAARAAATRRR
jgi:hypothetical protein